MLGFSLSKILFTAVMIMAVWWVYRQINRLTGDDREANPRVKTAKNEPAGQASREAKEVEDLTACPACGAYVAAGLNPGCGRDAKDCPMQK